MTCDDSTQYGATICKDVQTILQAMDTSELLKHGKEALVEEIMKAVEDTSTWKLRKEYLKQVARCEDFTVEDEDIIEDYKGAFADALDEMEG